MSATIDERIVSMKFDNAQFEAGARQTLATLQLLDKHMKFEGAGKGLNSAAKSLDNVAAATHRFSLAPIGSAVQTVSAKFSAMSAIALGIFGSIGAAATRAGANVARGFLSPITSGFHEYETNLNAVQTILANTQASGATLKDVNAALNDLNHYSDKTIYNFSEMARNIGTFTAAGVDLKTATGAIKGIANLAALSGSNSQQASTAMYQLSQAISAGRVSLQDWNSVVNAGMGGTVFQRALAQTAVNMGKLKDSSVKLVGPMKNVKIAGESFRSSIQAGPGKQSWLTSDVLTKTLQQFTGDLSNAQLKAQGFSDAQIKAIQLQAKTALDAATQVKTITQLFGTLSETAGSGWAQTFQLIFGDFGQAKVLFTEVNRVLSGFINTSSNARNKVLKDWAALGGRTMLIKGISNAFHALVAVIKPIKDAFRDIFPKTTGAQLQGMTLAFLHFTEGLKIGADTAKNLKSTFAGVFAVFDIGWQILKQVVGVIVDLFSAATDGSGSFLEITAGVGDFLVGLDKAIKSGDKLSGFFEKLSSVLRVPITLIKNLAGAFVALASNVDLSALDGLAEKFAPLAGIGHETSSVWSLVMDKLASVAKAAAGLPEKFAAIFQSIGKGITDAFTNGDLFNNFITLLQTGLLFVLVKTIRDFLKSLQGAADDVSGIVGTLTAPFSELTNTLKTMQTAIRAATLVQIAIAVALLTASVVALSKVDNDGLKRALGAMTVLFIELSGAMAVFQKVKISTGMGQLILLAAAVRILASALVEIGKLPLNGMIKGIYGIAAALALLVATTRLMPDGKQLINSSLGMIAMAAAVKILASAITDLSGLSWEELSKGLIGVGVVLGALTLFTRFAQANAGGVAQGAGLILLATGIKILASAVADLGNLSWEQMAKGLLTMAGGLLLMAAALNAVPASSLLSAAAIFVVAASLGMIGDAMAQMGGFSWDTIGKGLLVMAGALTAISIALALLPPSSLLSAAAIFIVASSLGLIGTALANMGGMSWEEIAKGLVTLAGALGIIAAAMLVMTTALPGAAALVIVTGALTLFLPVMAALGMLSWESIGKSMLMLAGSLTILGIAGALLTPVIPTLIGLGIAISLMGAGMALAGVGLLAFSAGLTALSVAGAAAVTSVVAIVAGLVGLLPMVATEIGQAIQTFALVIAKAAPAIEKAITAVILSMLRSIIKLTPVIGQALIVLVATMLRVLVASIPRMAAAGSQIIAGVLAGIGRNIGKIVTSAATLIVNFINGISKNQGRVVDAGVKMIISFINGVAEAIRSNSEAMGAAGANLGVAVVEGMARGIAGGLGVVTSAASRLAHSALDAAKNALGIHSPSREFAKLGKFSAQGFAQGLHGNQDAIKRAYSDMKQLLRDAMQSSAEDVQKLTTKLEKLNKARHRDRQAILETQKAIAKANAEHRKEANAYAELVKHRTDDTIRLERYARSYDILSQKLANAKKNLADATKARDDFRASIRDQFDALPDITGDTNLGDYTKELEKKVTDTQLFAAQLAKLRSMGLDNNVYKDLLAKGTDAMPFVQQILEGGQASVDQLNTLDSALVKASDSLGKTASTELYQAGVDAAAGLVKGLEKQMASIEKVMDRIADAMVKAIKKKLGIRSPSREFMEVGDWSALGLAHGLEASKAPVQAAERVGANAILAMRKSLTGVHDLVAENIDPNPAITPVLDLTDVEKQAGRLEGMLKTQPLQVGGAYSLASSASSEYQANQDAFAAAAAAHKEVQPTVQFVQNNNSPKALSEAEIYRQTKNQLSVAKGALAKKS